MATGTLAPSPYLTVLDGNGKPVSGALIYTYLAGTTTAATTYAEVSLTTANSNPIVADSSGRFVAFLSPGNSYKFVIQTSAGVAVRTQDNISAVPPTTSNLDITGVAGEAITAGKGVYLSDGSGGKTAGSWYKWDSANTYSSTLPEIGMVPAAIAQGATGTIRLSGVMTGLSGLVVGATEFVGTDGDLIETAPTNTRVVGVADTTSTVVISSAAIASVTPACRVYYSLTQSILDSVFTALTWDTEDYDIGSCHESVSHPTRLTVPSNQGGIYAVTATCSFATNATGLRAIEILKNGATSLQQWQSGGASATNPTIAQMTTQVQLAAGDYVEALVYQASGGALSVGSTGVSGQHNFMWVKVA